MANIRYGGRSPAGPLLSSSTTIREDSGTVASGNYRYSSPAPYPACFDNCARALQYLRAHAKSSTSIQRPWRRRALRPEPASRESTRISAAGVVDAQSSYDPHVIAKLLGSETANVGALRQLFAVPKSVADLTQAESAFPLFTHSTPEGRRRSGVSLLHDGVAAAAAGESK